MSTLQKPHPIMIIAALSLIILSLAGVAAMMGWLPNSHSQTEAAGTAAESGNANTDASKGESRTGGTDHAGTRSHTVRKLAAAGADFLAVSAGVWSFGDGPAAAVKRFNAEIARGLAERV